MDVICDMESCTIITLDPNTPHSGPMAKIIPKLTGFCTTELVWRLIAVSTDKVDSIGRSLLTECYLKFLGLQLP